MYNVFNKGFSFKRVSFPTPINKRKIFNLLKKFEKPRDNPNPNKRHLYYLAIAAGIGGGAVWFSKAEPNEEETENDKELIEEASDKTETQLEIPKNSVKDYWDLISEEWHFYLIGVSIDIIASLIGLKIQLLIGQIIDLAKIGTKMNDLIGPILNFSSVVMLHTILNFICFGIISYAGEQMASRLRRNIFKAILEQDIAFFDEANTGEMINRLSGEVLEVRRGVQHMISEGVRHGTQIIGGLFTLYKISPHLATFIAAVIPVMIFIGSVYGRYLRKISAQSKEASAKSVSISTESMQNIRTVRSFGNEEKELERYSKMDQRSEILAKKFGWSIALYRVLTSLAVNGLIVSLLAIGGSLIQRGTLTTGALASFLVTSITFQRSLGQITYLYGKATNSLAAYDRIRAVIVKKPTIPLHGGKKIQKINGELEFRNVTFSYPTRKENTVFNNLNLKLPEGKVLALVGPSGSGKSTIVSLIERFYDPANGQILLDGYDLKELDPTWLRQQIGIVSQEPILFHTSILENISYGKPDAPIDEVIFAAKLANCHSFIEGFPDGYQTLVGERGVQLSGGQKQRVAIARAILKNPKILILDEATSALDAASENLVQEALNTLMKNRTVLVIAHRLSTVKNADQIVMIKEGQLLESGTHQQLIEKNGEYANLVSKQLQQK